MKPRAGDLVALGLLIFCALALFDEWAWPRPPRLAIDGPRSATPAAMADPPLCTFPSEPAPPGRYERRRAFPPDPRSVT